MGLKTRLRANDSQQLALLAGLYVVVWALSAWSLQTAVIVAMLFILVAAVGPIRTSMTQSSVSTEQATGSAVNDAELSPESQSTNRRFLSNISHEIRTPMNGILGMTELLTNTPLDKTQSGFVATINRSTESLLHIINDVLDFSQLEGGKIQLQKVNFTLRDSIQDVCDLHASIAERKGIELMCTISESAICQVRGDLNRFKQVLTNLVGNAIKFTQQGEVVVRANYDKSSGCCEISVSDTGCGISDDIQSHIFQAFAQGDSSSTRLFGGVGLGLTISNRLAHLMGGSIKLSSSPLDKGSVFTFSVKLLESTEPLAIEPDHHTLRGIRALIVDDNETNRTILQQQLQNWGLHVRCCHSGESALEELQQSHSMGSTYDIAILDLNMPDMDGIQLARRIKDSTYACELNMMMLTSSLLELDEAELLQLGVLTSITKPARQEILYEAILTIVGRQATTDAQLPLDKLRVIKILLTEDNPINQEVASIMLESMGCEVDVAEDGSEAINALEKDTYDLVFMDCQMPVMDGFEATRKIRNQSKYNDLPVIALTANAMEGDRELCIASGMDDYLSKPINQNELLRMVNRWVPMPKPTTSSSRQSASTKVNNTMNFDIDENALNAIKALQRPGKPDILAKIVNMYLTKTPELIAEIENGIAESDSARVKMAAHTLKSSSAYVGATSLADQCNKLESKAANDELSETQAHVEAINTGFDAVAVQIKQFG